MSFLGCVGTPIKVFGVEILITSAFTGITSIVNGIACTKALRAYRLITVVFLKNFYSDGAKPYEELDIYLRTTREHPTERLWVDCLVNHTILAHVPARRAKR